MKILIILSLLTTPLFAKDRNCMDQGSRYKSKKELRKSGQKSFGFNKKCQSFLEDQRQSLDRISQQHHNGQGMSLIHAESSSTAWDRATKNNRNVQFPSLIWFDPGFEFHKRGIMKFGNRKTWSFAVGEKESLISELKPFIGFFSSRLEAAAEAGVELHGSYMGVWEGNLASLRTVAFSPGTGPLSADLQLFGPDGKQMWGRNIHKGGQIKFDKYLSRHIAMDTKLRFAIGPVPLASEFGAVGTIGFNNSLALFPMQVSAWGKPFVGAEAYLMAGADIWLVGAGAGGQLKLASDHISFAGKALVEYNEEPTIRLETELTNNINLLSGELFAYVFLKIPLLRNRWMGKFTLFNWQGYDFDKTLYESKFLVKRDRTLAFGDADQSDRSLLRGWQIEKQNANAAIGEEDLSRQDSLLSRLTMQPERLQRALEFSQRVLQSIESK
ncbi:hypothetical protein N9D31_03570 [Oligoflexaceae bacterium]|nr:hypothetical protein [Oligoflexaceae bacterium]